MSWILDLALNGGVPLLLGILAGQKVRITLDGKKLPVKVPSRKATGKSAKRTKADALAPSPSPSEQDPTLPYMVDRPS